MNVRIKYFDLSFYTQLKNTGVTRLLFVYFIYSLRDKIRKSNKNERNLFILIYL